MTCMKLAAYRDIPTRFQAALAAVGVGLLTLAALTFFTSDYFKKFMLSPAGGAFLTIFATGTIGFLAWSQGNSRLEFERVEAEKNRQYAQDRDALDRAEAHQVRRFDRQFPVLVDLMNYIVHIIDETTIALNSGQVDRCLERLDTYSKSDEGYRTFAAYATLSPSDAIEVFYNAMLRHLIEADEQGDPEVRRLAISLARDQAKNIQKTIGAQIEHLDKSVAELGAQPAPATQK